MNMFGKYDDKLDGFFFLLVRANGFLFSLILDLKDGFHRPS